MDLFLIPFPLVLTRSLRLAGFRNQFPMRQTKRSSTMSAPSFVQLGAVALLFLAGCVSHPVQETKLDLHSLPRYSNIHPYKLEPFVPVAISLQKLGPKRGSQALLEAAKTANYFDDYEKVVVLCRMLFKFHEGRTYIYPSLGERVFFWGHKLRGMAARAD